MAGDWKVQMFGSPKPTTGERKLRIGVNWQGALQQKRVKQRTWNKNSVTKLRRQGFRWSHSSDIVRHSPPFSWRDKKITTRGAAAVRTGCSPTNIWTKYVQNTSKVSSVATTLTRSVKGHVTCFHEIVQHCRGWKAHDRDHCDLPGTRFGTFFVVSSRPQSGSILESLSKSWLHIQWPNEMSSPLAFPHAYMQNNVNVTQRKPTATLWKWNVDK
jgi:hypothetical protein